MTFPTATVSRLGSGRFSAGPALVGLYMDGPWVVGALANQHRPPVAPALDPAPLATALRSPVDAAAGYMAGRPGPARQEAMRMRGATAATLPRAGRSKRSAAF